MADNAKSMSGRFAAIEKIVATMRDGYEPRDSFGTGATVTPLGQLPFFIEYLKQGGLFDGWGADCPLHYTSPNARTSATFSAR